MVTLGDDDESAAKPTKSVSFAKCKAAKDTDSPEAKTFPGSKAVWPRSTRHRLFLPYFQVICPLHANFVCINQNYLVGKGKFGTVFAGEIINKRYQSCIKCAKTHQMMQTPEDGRVAVKELKKSVVLKNEAEVQIIEETRIHSVCSGLPNILPFIKAWQDAHHLYVAFPVCHRGTLADLFVSRKAAPFPSQSILVAAHQLFKGLNAIHNLGIVYRDVKLKNVLLSESGNLLITDFGLAKWLSRRQRTRTICGTLAFMAPEVAQGRPYNHSVDLWSLGVLLFCMAFAKLPYPKVSNHEELADIFADQSQPPLDQIRSHENDQVRLVLENLLNFDPSVRNFIFCGDEHLVQLPAFLDTV